jgi:hypothetical protein
MDSTVARVVRDQCAAGVQGFLEELPESVGLGAFLGRVLFPDAGVGRDGEEGVEVSWLEWAEFK